MVVSFKSLGSLLIVLLIGFSASSFAQEGRKTIVLIFPIKVTGLNLTASEREGIKDYLGTRLTMEGVYKVMPESQVKRDLGLAKVQSYNDCYDEACRIDLTKTVYADKSLSVDVISEGGVCRVTAKLYDMAQEATETGADVETGCSAKEIKAAMVLAGAQLSGKAVKADATRIGAPGGGTVTAGVQIDRGENIVNEITDQTGLLFVETDPPKANILINGKPYGKAPYQDALMVGRYMVSATLNSYYHDAIQEINLTTEGATVNLKLPPSFGTLLITSEPSDSEVLIDDKPVGRTPFTDARIKSGEYRIEVRRDLYKSEAISVVVRDGEDVSRLVRLAADYGSMDVVTDPPGASVIVDGQDTGKVTPASFQQMATGLHIITLDLEAHGRRVENVRVTAGQTEQVSVELEPKMGLLTVMTLDAEGSPCQGSLTIDGHSVGTTPWKGSLIATAHTIEATCDDGVKSEIVNVEYNGTRTLKLQVEKKVKTIVGKRPVAAVFDINVSGMKMSLAVVERLTKYLESRLLLEGTYQIVSRDSLKRNFEKMKADSHTGVYDDVCRIELGSAVSADRAVGTDIIKTGRLCSITADVYDIQKEILESTAKVTEVNCSEESLMKALQGIARQLSSGIAVVSGVPEVAEGSDRKPVLAVTGINVSGLELGERLLASLTDSLIVYLVKANSYSVIAKSDVREAFIESGLPSTKRFDDQTLIHIGRSVAAEKILNARISRIGATCFIIGMIFDLRTETYEKSHEIDMEDCSESSLRQGISEMVTQISR